MDAAFAPLVCGVDFSPESRRALRYSSALAVRLACRLHVVSAIEPLLAEAARIRNQFDAFADQVSRDLRAFATPSPLPPDRVSFEAPEGEPAPVLLAAARRAQARMIVVGTRGWGRTARLFLGSTTLRLLRATDRPVLVADWDDESDASDAEPGAAVSHVVCGVDFSDGSLAAVDRGARLAADLRAGLRLVHAVARANVPVGWDGLASEVEAERMEHATKRLTEVARTLTGSPAVRARIGSPADVLVAEVEADPHAIVAVGLRGLAHHRPGSTALRVVSLAQVPVLAVPEQPANFSLLTSDF